MFFKDFLKTYAFLKLTYSTVLFIGEDGSYAYSEEFNESGLVLFCSVNLVICLKFLLLLNKIIKSSIQAITPVRTAMKMKVLWHWNRLFNFSVIIFFCIILTVSWLWSQIWNFGDSNFCKPSTNTMQ